MKLSLLYLLIINIVTFFLYGIDKWKAQHDKWRIRENVLIGIAILGGSIGAIWGMYTFRHKTYTIYSRITNYTCHTDYIVYQGAKNVNGMYMDSFTCGQSTK